ncbi:unnamed protein product [Didymodactylos carnosus]|uniref:Uncharacterized protein n=1 Tax=Didymodactylos carnosus TaxID=1234261 RepID=A0A814FZ09_9BILA|nr:unnamed protein product [Didymodactylos carnosus]CAF3761335.1 unnamed protein product [Didymodactylos carnosus]
MSFAEKNGWKAEHTQSMLFSDIIESGFAQLLYTRLTGFGINSFNLNIRQWEKNLKARQLNIKEKYLIPATFIPTSKGPTRSSVLITNQNGRLNAFEIKKAPFRLLENSLDEELILSSSSLIEGKFSAEFKEQRRLNLEKVPQIVQPIVKGRSPILLRDSLDIKPLLSSVNTVTGKDTSVLGIGWDLIQEYLAVDYQGSLDPSVQRYYWIIGNEVLLLIRQTYSETINTQIFMVAEQPNIKLTYYHADQHWKVIVKQNEKRIYGGTQSPFDKANATGFTIGWKH